MNQKKKNLTDLVLNALIVISTVLSVGSYFFSGPDLLGSVRSGCFKYFTTDSNVLAAAASLAFLYFNIRKLSHPEEKLPKWVLIFKFTGTVSVAITLLTVVFFLGPTAAVHGGMKAYFRFFEGNTFALHFSTPVLAIVSLLFFETEGTLTKKDVLFGLLPTVVYSFVYLVLVVFVKVWFDWYGFTFGGKLFMAPVSMIVMYLATFAVSVVLAKLRREETQA